MTMTVAVDTCEQTNHFIILLGDLYSLMLCQISPLHLKISTANAGFIKTKLAAC